MTSKIRIERTQSPKSKPPMKELGFGRFFSDHMFVVNYTAKTGWTDPRVVPYGPFSMDPAAAVFHYGQELFEGLKAYRSKNNRIHLFRPKYNCARIQDGARRLCMPEIPADLMLEGMKALISIDKDWIPGEKGTALYVRPTLIASEAFLGVRPSEEYIFYVICSPVGSYYADSTRGVKIWVESEHVRAASGGLGAVKAGANYAASLQAAFNAKKKGYAQVLWLDGVHRKYVEEVGTMNVFFAFEKEIVTPALQGTILPGSIRETCIHLLRTWGLNIVERAITIDEIVAGAKSGQLREVWGTGTAAVISPVEELSYKGQDIKIPTTWGDLSTRLFKTIGGIQTGELPDEFNWIEAFD